MSRWSRPDRGATGACSTYDYDRGRLTSVAEGIPVTRAAHTEGRTPQGLGSSVAAPRRRARRIAVLAGVAVVASLGLSGCGSDHPATPGAALVVGDVRISEADVQQATKEVNESIGLTGAGALPQRQILAWLLIEPNVTKAARDLKVVVSEADVDAKVLGIRAEVAQSQPSASKASPKPYPLTPIGRRAWLGYLNFTASLQTIGRSVQGDDQDGAKATKAIMDWWKGIIKDINTEDVIVNPRYGSYKTPDVDTARNVDDLMAFIGEPQQNWISSNTPKPSPSGTPPPSASVAP